MKFAGDVYSIDKDEEAKLRNRIEMLKNTLTPKQTIHLTMVTTYGVAYGKHSGIVQKQVTMICSADCENRNGTPTACKSVVSAESDKVKMFFLCLLCCLLLFMGKQELDGFRCICSITCFPMIHVREYLECYFRTFFTELFDYGFIHGWFVHIIFA